MFSLQRIETPIHQRGRQLLRNLSKPQPPHDYPNRRKYDSCLLHLREGNRVDTRLKDQLLPELPYRGLALEGNVRLWSDRLQLL